MRYLILDYSGKVEETRVLSRSSDIVSLLEDYRFLKTISEVVLDCRGLSDYNFNKLLVFIESFSGSLKVYANDPVPGPVFSRFLHVKKYFNRSTEQNRADWYYKALPENKLNQLRKLYMK